MDSTPAARAGSHYEQIARFADEVVRGQDVPQMEGQALIRFGLFGFSAFFMLDTEVVRRVPPTGPDIEPGIKGHLGPSSWQDWLDRRSAAAPLVESAATLWKETARELTSFSSSLGLVTIHKFTNDQVDTFWPSLLVQSIWSEQALPAAETSLLRLKDAKITQQDFVLPMRHTLDSVSVWGFEGSNIVKSQSKEPVERIKGRWEEVLASTSERARSLAAERERLLKSGAGLLEALASVSSEYQRTGRVSGTCELCRLSDSR